MLGSNLITHLKRLFIKIMAGFGESDKAGIRQKEKDAQAVLMLFPDFYPKHKGKAHFLTNCPRSMPSTLF